MEEFACKNLGLDCNFTATADAREDIMRKAIEHGGTVHVDLVKSMTKEQVLEFVKKLEAAIQKI